MFNITANTELNTNLTGNIPSIFLKEDSSKSISNSQMRISTIEPLKLTINNIMQAKVAVFKVERDAEKGTVTKAEFLREFWINKVSGISLELLAAKEVENFDPLTMVIREIYSVNF